MRATLEGRKVLLGNLKLIRDEGVPVDGLEGRAEALADQGKTPMLVAVDGRPAGLIAVADTLKPTSIQAVERLKAMGLAVSMITGDNARTAQAIARQVGVDNVLSEVLPEDKAYRVEELQDAGSGGGHGGGRDKRRAGAGPGGRGDRHRHRHGRGHRGLGHHPDGRGPAGGGDGDRSLPGDDGHHPLEPLLGVRLQHAGDSHRGGVLYPFTGILLNPIIAAAAMAFSSVFVVTNSLRLRRFRPAIPEAAPVGETIALNAEQLVSRPRPVDRRGSGPQDGAITIYTQPSCADCASLKAFLRQRGVDFVEKDVTADPEAMDELRELAGRFATPAIVLNDEVILGFAPNRERVEQMVAARASSG